MNDWKKEIRNPITIISITLAVLSILLTIYFYFISKRIAVPSFRAYTNMSKLIDSTRITHRVSIVDQNGNKINGDIYYYEATFWNAGNIGIEPEAVREPLTITVSGDSQILDWEIIDKTKEEITKFDIERAFKEPNTRLEVSWKHLDPGDGFRFFLLVKSTKKQKPTVSIDGAFAEAQEIKEAGPIYTKVSKYYVIPVFIISTLFPLCFVLFLCKGIEHISCEIGMSPTKNLRIFSILLAVAIYVFIDTAIINPIIHGIKAPF